MADKLWYYVMQVVQGQVFAHGPYSLSRSRDNRMENVQGGEVNAFNSYSSDPKTAIEEFKVQEV